MIKTLKIIKKTIGTIITLVFIAIFAIAAFSAFTSFQTGEPAFVLGYRPVFIVSGSMEPEIAINGIVLTHEVKAIDELHTGDIITFTVPKENNMRVTHRITSIEDGIIRTKGDNNRVEDLYDTSISEVQSKVVGIFNQSAWVISEWNRGLSGQIFLIAIPLSVICFIFFLASFVNEYIEKAEEKIQLKKDGK